MKVKIFYGWYIVGASVLIMAFIGGVVSYGFTALVNPIAASMGWSYTQISLAISIRSLENGLLAPFVGRAIDRWPAKRLVLIGVTIAGLGYIIMSQVATLPMFYVSFMIVALGSSIGISMVPTTTVVRWFKRNVGKATGVLAFGAGIGGLLTPLLVKIIDTFSWRISLVILAAVVWVVGIPLSFLFRNRPEDYGMFPDGNSAINVEGLDSNPPYDFSVGVKEALKMRAFWYLGIADLIQMAGFGALMLHMMPHLTSLGIDRATAAMIAMSIPLVSMPARFAFGWAGDVFQKRYMVALSITLMGIGIFAFSFISVDSIWWVIIFIVTYAFGLGGIIPLRTPILREYFGTRHFGAILGLHNVFMTVAMMISPPLAGWVFDTRGLYYPVWLVLGGVLMVGALIMLKTPPAPRNL